MELIERYHGSILGMAAGDALGTTLEFRPPGTFSPLTAMVGGGPFHLEPGQWTDDTSMALCLANSLIECRGFDPADQMRRYARWWQEGYLSCTGSCFDIGNATSGALARFVRTGEPYSGSTDPRSAGNGSLMRLAPVPLAFAGRPEEAIALAAESSRTTHAAPECLSACRYFAGLLVGALQGQPKDALLSEHYTPVAGPWEAEPLAPKVAAVAMGAYRQRNPPAIRGTGYVVATLEAALWAFSRTDTFRDGALLVVNLGDDADTTGAVYGQIAGAFYGAAGIPAAWRERLCRRDWLDAAADGLYALAQSATG